MVGNSWLAGTWLRTFSPEGVKNSRAYLPSVFRGRPGHCLVLASALNMEPSLCWAQIQASVGVLPGAHMVPPVRSTVRQETLASHTPTLPGCGREAVSMAMTE